MLKVKIIKAWKKYNKIFVQIGTGKKGESSNFEFENNKLYKSWKDKEMPNSEFDYEGYNISLEDIEKAIEEVSSNA